MTFNEIILERRIRKLEIQVEELEEDKILLQHLLEMQEAIEEHGCSEESNLQNLFYPDIFSGNFYEPGMNQDQNWIW